MDEQESGSSAIVIGLIIGGGVVLLLVVLAVFGAGFFFMAREAPPPVGAPVAVGPVGGPMVAIEQEAPPLIAPPAAEGRARLIGTWEAKTPDDGQATLQFLADGTLQLSTTQPEKGEPLKSQGRWDVIEDAGDRLKLRRTAADNTDSVQDIRFDGPDRFVIEGKGGGVYTRKAK